MAATGALIEYLDELLSPGAFADMGPNGLQVPGGAAEVRRVVTGVTAQRALFERAIAEEAELVLVHHGLFWDFQPVGLTPTLAERLRPLFKHDIALAAYHLPLDAHAEHGNNAQLAEALGASSHDPFADVGRAATFAEPVPAAELFARVAAVTGREPLVFDAGPGDVRRLAIISGGAASRLPQAIAEGYDAFLTGEPKENVMADAQEAGIHFIAAGHYATETFGVRRLGELLAGRFGVEHVWVDLPNPV
jgi:dinuclear metal center YbgI/SA1388 family protein